MMDGRKQTHGNSGGPLVEPSVQPSFSFFRLFALHVKHYGPLEGPCPRIPESGIVELRALDAHSKKLVLVVPLHAVTKHYYYVLSFLFMASLKASKRS